MKLNFFFILFLLSTRLLYAQTEDTTLRKSLTDKELAIACADFKKMISSETYVVNEKLTKELSDKTNKLLLTISPSQISSPELLLKYIEKNFTETKFKDLDEAKALIYDLNSSSEKLFLENERIFNYYFKIATAQQISEIRKPLLERDSQNIINNRK